MTVRTRVAPSPTGDPHVGTAYAALFNYCFAKANGGEFILRIEDTDQKRSTAASEQAILDALTWTGITWDEGPDVGGPHGPYRQSERAALYVRFAQELIDKGAAFRCFCTAERLLALRKEQEATKAEVRGYDGHCMGLSREESDARAAAGEPFVVRLVVPRAGVCTVTDLFRGAIEIPWTQVDMQVLLKSDGLPTYHLANVVDDHLMGITHVMRGEEWINSAPKHLLMYEAFGWDAPKLGHLPLLRNADRSKLSKRKNPTGILWYRDMGVLPEALLNYLGQMAYSMPDDQEIFSLDEMASSFQLDRVALGGPIFDYEKLTWVNRSWLRDRLTDDEFVDRAMAWKLNRETYRKMAPLLRTRVTTLGDITPMSGFLTSGRVPVDKALLESLGEPKELLAAYYLVTKQLNELTSWEAAGIEAVLKGTAAFLDTKLRTFLPPFYVAMSGQKVSLPLFESMELLGPELVRDRIRQCIDALGGAGKKVQKRLDKQLVELKRQQAE